MRHTDLHSYVLLHKPDIISLQETGPVVPGLRGYDSHVLGCNDGSSRGLVTYVKFGLPVTLVEMGVNGGTEFITVCLHLVEGDIYFINMYVHSGALHIEDFPMCVFEECTVIAGDLNARHVDLGSYRTSNINGERWVTFLDATDTIYLTGNKVPTHVQGGRLDYVTLFNFSSYTAETQLVPHLLSDHFALETTLPLTTTSIVPRKRLAVSVAQEPQLQFRVKEWYAISKGTFLNSDSFYQEFVTVIEDFVNVVRAQKHCPSSLVRPYANDPLLISVQTNLAILQRRWVNNPSNCETREAMVTVAKHLTELRREVRRKYWCDFLEGIRKTKSLKGVWRHVNRVRGKKPCVISDPHPARKAQVLLEKWTSASALSMLPTSHRLALAEHRLQRLQTVNHTVTVEDDTCVPITYDELLYAVKHGKSTAPGEDGLTYSILNSLLSIHTDNPILDLFNMSYSTGSLPSAWKAAVIIPVPKGDGSYRPISLTSCLCKMMERIVLHRLLYKVGDNLSSNLFGFMKGRSTGDCFVHCLSNTNVSTRVFIDLKGAFDRANKDVILEELVHKGVKGKLLGWIRDYLCNRTGKVWFQGVYSNKGSFELGTPQGGVLSPMLFNILMDKIARHPFPQGTQVIIYADDILLQSDTPQTLTFALRELEQLCLSMGLIINEQKTKFQTKLKYYRKPIINGIKVDNAITYKYLGAKISFKKNLHCIEYVENLCASRLAPLKVLANRGSGAGVPVLRMFYIYMLSDH